MQKIIQLICVIFIYNHWWISLGDQMRIIDLTCKPQSVSRQRYQNTNHNTKVESLYTKITLQVVNFMINCEATFMKWKRYNSIIFNWLNEINSISGGRRPSKSWIRDLSLRFNSVRVHLSRYSWKCFTFVFIYSLFVLFN